MCGLDSECQQVKCKAIDFLAPSQLSLLFSVLVGNVFRKASIRFVSNLGFISCVEIS